MLCNKHFFFNISPHFFVKKILYFTKMQNPNLTLTRKYSVTLNAKKGTKFSFLNKKIQLLVFAGEWENVFSEERCLFSKNHNPLQSVSLRLTNCCDPFWSRGGAHFKAAKIHSSLWYFVTDIIRRRTENHLFYTFLLKEVFSDFFEYLIYLFNAVTLFAFLTSIYCFLDQFRKKKKRFGFYISARCLRE